MRFDWRGELQVEVEISMVVRLTVTILAVISGATDITEGGVNFEKSSERNRAGNAGLREPIAERLYFAERFVSRRVLRLIHRCGVFCLLQKGGVFAKVCCACISKINSA